MKLLNTWLREAIALSSASAAASVTASGSFMGLLRTMDRGTMLSMSARREDSPMTDSICRSSVSSTPIWRAMNSDLFSSSLSGRADCINISGGRFQEPGIGRLVHELVELGHVLDEEFEKPAVAHRVPVGQRRVGAQLLVDFSHLARHRHVH